MISNELHNLAEAFGNHTLHEIDVLQAVLHAGDSETLRHLLHYLMQVLMHGEAVRACVYNQIQIELARLNAPDTEPEPPVGLLADLPPARQRAPRISDFPKYLDISK